MFLSSCSSSTSRRGSSHHLGSVEPFPYIALLASIFHFLISTNPKMMRPFLFHDFFNPHAPPQEVHIRVEENNPLQTQFRDLMNQWPVKKVLTERDITCGQVIMPKDQVEGYILPLLLPDEQNLINRRDYSPITVRDLDTLSEFCLCFWKNGSSSYVLTKGWSSCFVERRGLDVGEEIGFCWDQRLRELRFSVLSRPPGRRQDEFGLM